MATKKSLGDLLRQEAEKMNDSETEDKTTVVSVKADVVEISTPNNDSEIETAVAELKQSLAQEEKQVKTLKSDLKKATEQAEKRESSLQEQIDTLKGDLEDKNKQIQKLQKQLDKVKEDARQLAESNSQLEQQTKTSPKPNALVKTQPKTASHEPLPSREHSEFKGEFLKFAEQAHADPSDFASSTWLLD